MLLRNLARMVRYSFKESKIRTLKNSLKKIRKTRRSKPFFRTSKRAKKQINRSSSRGQFENMDKKQVESLKKELGWDSTVTVLQSKIKKSCRKKGQNASNFHSSRSKNSKSKS
jgi:U3 small nucleolar ribonucleoprotein component